VEVRIRLGSGIARLAPRTRAQASDLLVFVLVMWRLAVCFVERRLVL
jgi:hypothetical protein